MPGAAAARFERPSAGRVADGPSHVQRPSGQGGHRGDRGDPGRTRGCRRRDFSAAELDPGRPRRRDPLRRHGGVRPAHRRGPSPTWSAPSVCTRRRSRTTPPAPAPRLDRGRGGGAQGRDPRGHARPSRGLAGGVRPRDRRASRRRGREPASPRSSTRSCARPAPARTRRAPVGRRRRRGTAQDLGDQDWSSTGERERKRSAGPTTTRSPRRWANARSRSSRPRTARRCRSCGLDHRVVVRPSVPWVDRGLQDGRADHPRVRPGTIPTSPGSPRASSTSSRPTSS